MNTGAVELSIKVVDDETRLADTLLHELCHAAVCLLGDGKKHPGKYPGNCHSIIYIIAHHHVILTIAPHLTHSIYSNCYDIYVILYTEICSECGDMLVLL